MLLRDKILSEKEPKRYYDLCKENLKDAEGNFFCGICGELKKEFTHPSTGRIILLDCECERYLAMLIKTYSEYRSCKHGNIFYSDFIDQHKKPVSETEKEILEYGVKMRDEIYRLKKLKER